MDWQIQLMNLYNLVCKYHEEKLPPVNFPVTKTGGEHHL